MRKKFGSKEGLDRQMDEQFVKEARIIEQALLSNVNAEDCQESEEKVRDSYDRLIRRLKAEGIYRERPGLSGSISEGADRGNGRGYEEDRAEKVLDGERPGEETAADESGEKRIVLQERVETVRKRRDLHFRERAVRAAGFILACAIGVFALTMTSEGNREYLIKEIQIWMGSDEKVIMGNDDMVDSSVRSEYEAIAEIEKELNIDMPEFWYRPPKFEYKDYRVNKMAGTAWIEYYCGEQKNIVTLYVSDADEVRTSTSYSMHGEVFETVTMNRENIQAYLNEVEDENEELPRYYAKWERKNVLYQIAGRMPLEELEKLVKNIVY